MGRAMTPVNTAVLQGIIDDVERSGEFASHMPLFTKCAEIYNQKLNPNKKITGSVIYLRHKEGKITTKVQKGRRGGHFKGRTITDEHKAAIIAGRRNKLNREIPEEHRQALYKAHPGYEATVDRALNGSKKAQTKIKCLNCCGFDRDSIRYCRSLDCINWLDRPYQQKENSSVACESERQSVIPTV